MQDMCKWVGEGECCQHHSIPGKSYCEKHYDRMYLTLFPEMADYIIEKELKSSQKRLIDLLYIEVYNRSIMFIKYPRTHHLPWSPGATDDDKILNDLSCFNGKRVIVTKKMDGENTTMYSNHIHARSLDSKGGIDRDWCKTLWATFAHNIPEDWRICGENLWATHSIHYTDLPSYFMGFSIWDEANICLGWDDTLQWFQMLGIEPVPIMYDFIWDEGKIRKIHTELSDNDEGFVVRNADRFHYDGFQHNVVKYVRKDHVQTDSHWRTQSFVPNVLIK